MYGRAKVLFCAVSAGIVSVAGYYLFMRYQRRQRQINIVPTGICIVTTLDDWEQAYSLLSSDFCRFKVLGFDCEWSNSPSEHDSDRRRVSLIQLASVSGACVLIRVHLLKHLPETLLTLLADRSILKVGVACLDDANRLARDYGIVCVGCVDLRHVAHRTLKNATPTNLGLQGLTKVVLGVDLNKCSRVRCSDWESDELSPEQVYYAACDALAAVLIFLKMADCKLRSSRSSDAQRVLSMFQGLVDLKYSTKTTSNNAARVNNRGSQRSPASNGFRAYVVRKTPLYYNCQMRSPDGQLLCTCDLKKATWYIDKGLAVKTSDEPMTIQLLFEPSGRPLDESNYYVHDKENVCVVCGSAESYIRKNIIPREYRKHFPAMLKEHKSHDILLMCVSCHQRSNIHDNALKEKLLRQSVPGELLLNGSEKYVNDPTLTKIKSAAKALLSKSVDQIPENRREELREIVCNFYGTMQLDEHTLQTVAAMDTRLKRDGFEDPGELVVRHVIEHMDGGLMAFERLWRQHFLDTMKPQFLPVMWSVDHSHGELQLLERDVMRLTVNETHDTSADLYQ